MPAQQVSPFAQMLPLFLIFIIFYFMLIRPQKRKEKEHRKMLDSIGKNNEVVTTGGIHGTVVAVKDKTLILRVDENVKIEIEKSSIAYVKKGDGAESGA